MAAVVPSPPVLWAQRKNLIYLNVALEDCKDPKITVEKDKLYFRGKGGPDLKEHEVTLELLKEIKPEESKYSVKSRGTEFVLIKSEEGFWPRLLKGDKKFHWLKTDFEKWRDEDDSDDEVGGGGGAGGADFEEMMRQMGGLGGAGGPGALDDLEDEKDSDDENIPDLE